MRTQVLGAREAAESKQVALPTLCSRNGVVRSKGLRGSDWTAGRPLGCGLDPSPTQALKMMI